MFLGVPISLIKRIGWTTLGYAAGQVLRLLNNVVLARLLAPEIFGLMALANGIRNGVELLSDVGITQNIISSPKGDHPDFYDTAWTMQVLRGLGLALICFLAAGPSAAFFRYPELASILRVASLFFVFSGLDSTTRGLIQKRLLVRRSVLFHTVAIAFAVVAQIALALVTRTVWALVLGGILAGAVNLILSFLLMPGTRHRFMIDPESARQLMSFGKWVFFSSMVFFLAMNFDRFYFAKQITLAQLGVYGIARALADMVTLLVQNCAGYVLYPTVAAAGLAPAELRQRMLRGRRTLLFLAAVGMGVFLALSSVVVRILYDVRYAEAAVILPILCVGAWFSILTATNDAILMGLSRPAYPALSNAAKLASYVIAAPLAFYFYGFTAAVMVIIAGEVVKYVALWLLSHKEHLRFGRDDVVLTIVFIITAVAGSLLLKETGLAGAAQGIHLRSLLASLR